MQNPLAIRVLEGEFDDGDTVLVDRGPGAAQLSFRAAGREAPREEEATAGV